MEGKAIITVVGKDKVGIIYSVTKILMEKSVNIEDISQTILQDYFTMMMLVNLSEANC
ncbi:MAG: ACT domain-containing protein, partial [Spirochaetales bacterium]|nr:ACT domain-containing protein [Spirochaetales bacterium]